MTTGVISRMLAQQRKSSAKACRNYKAARQRAIDRRDEVLELIDAAVRDGSIEPPHRYRCSECRRRQAVRYEPGWFEPGSNYADWGAKPVCASCGEEAPITQHGN